MNTTIAPCLAALTLATGCFSPAPTVPDSMDTDGMGTDGTGEVASTGQSDADSGQPPADSGSSSGGGQPPAGEETEGDDDVDFIDEFDADNGQWTFGDDPGAEQEGPGQWAYRDGDLVQLSDISGPDGVTPSLGTYAIGGDVDWDAYRVEVAFTADDDGVAGVLCHATPEGNYVRFDLDHETGLVQLVRAEGGTFTLLAEVEAFTPPVELGVQRVLGLECGADYRAFVDGELVLEAPGDAAAEGGVGLYASSIGDGPNGLLFHWLEVD